MFSSKNFVYLFVKSLNSLLQKMVKYTQTNHRLLPTNFLSEFDHFVWLALKGVGLGVGLGLIHSETSD